MTGIRALGCRHDPTERTSAHAISGPKSDRSVLHQLCRSTLPERTAVFGISQGPSNDRDWAQTRRSRTRPSHRPDSIPRPSPSNSPSRQPAPSGACWIGAENATEPTNARQDETPAPPKLFEKRGYSRRDSGAQVRISATNACWLSPEFRRATWRGRLRRRRAKTPHDGRQKP